ncbi:hypothetical protein DIPPA_13251 [Diplonema papillatum]|nr:hypothetical protein DIPPA_13251 [Diplonema papillatum]
MAPRGGGCLWYVFAGVAACAVQGAVRADDAGMRGLGTWEFEGGARDIQAGRFLCPTCNASRDCGTVASEGRVRDAAWKLWRPDGHYRGELAALNKLSVCIRKWMNGCNGAAGLNFCNSLTEVCSTSEAPFDASVRAASPEVCSSDSFMSSASATLIFTVPIALSSISLVAIIGTLYHSFSKGYCQCPPSLSKVPLMFSSTVLLVFSFLTFFSPHMAVGAVGMIVGILSINAHTVAAQVQDSTTEGVSEAKAQIERAQRWLVATSVTTFALLFFVYSSGYSELQHTPMDALGKDCVAFYNFFAVDPFLLGPGDQKDSKYWGYCEADYIEDTLWNITAIFWLGLVLGGIHVHSTISLHVHVGVDPDMYQHPGEVAGGPGSFLVGRHPHMQGDFFAGRLRAKDHSVMRSVESYSDLRLTPLSDLR